MLKVGQKAMTRWGLVMEVIQPVVGTTGTWVMKGKNKRHPSIPIYVCMRESELIPDDNPNFVIAQDNMANADMRGEEADKFNEKFMACFPQRVHRIKPAPPADPNAPKSITHG